MRRCRFAPPRRPTPRRRRSRTAARCRRSQPPEKRRDADPQALRDVRERGERRRDTPGLHLPDVLLLEVHPAATVGAELGHGEALLLPERADTLTDALREERLTRDVRVDACRHQLPRATKSTMAESASSP